MKFKTFAFSLALLTAMPAFAADNLKALSSMYEIKTEVYRFARLRREMTRDLQPEQGQKLKTQLKASVQELMLNLHDSKAGFEKLKLQAEYQKMDNAISELLTESAMGSAPTEAMQEKQTKAIALSDELTTQLIQKIGTPNAKGVALIGSTKVSIEKLAFDFGECSKDCAKILPEDLNAIQTNIASMRSTLGTSLKKNTADMIDNQMIFLKQSVTAKAQGKADETMRTYLIATTGNLWKLVDEVLDTYVESTGG
jgi:hypothetical protein